MKYNEARAIADKVRQSGVRANVRRQVWYAESGPMRRTHDFSVEIRHSHGDSDTYRNVEFLLTPDTDWYTAIECCEPILSLAHV